jgi:predicted GIY-YIG superfamily endonuclease
MGRKTTNFNKTGIDKLPNDKPVLYKIQTSSGNTNYAGIAKKGRVQNRLSEHLGNIPGAKVQIEQFSSIRDAAKKERNVISRSKPKYNKSGV